MNNTPVDKVKKTLGFRTNRRRLPRAPRRWHVEITDENTLVRILSFRLTGIRVYIAMLVVVASVASLLVVFFTFTPVGRWIWGERNLREQYVDLSLRLDSISSVASVNDAYASNILAILTDSLSTDSIPAVPPSVSDTLISASEAEKRFVEQFEAEKRFNLSVLAPIAAEGMFFEAPVLHTGEGGPVMAVYRGTVIGRYVSPDGKITLVVQHPNDFISSYGRLSDAYVAQGDNVTPGQRIGLADDEPVFELWRAGALLDPANYIQFPVPTTIDK